MHTRRSALALGTSALIASTAGCIASIPFIGDDPLEFSATSVAVEEPVLDETGYEEHDVEEVVIEETVEAGGETQDVIVTNWQAEYDKEVNLGDIAAAVDGGTRAAVFTALTTPQVRVLGQTFNPVADMSSEELAEMVQDRYEGMQQLEQVGEETVTVSGESTTVGEFEGEATLIAEGVAIEVTLHIAEAVPSGDDLVICVGGYPTQLRDEERSNVYAMMDAIDHNG